MCMPLQRHTHLPTAQGRPRAVMQGDIGAGITIVFAIA